jgi:hypothetical protein
MAGDLFMSRGDELDLVPAVMESIEQTHIAMAADAKDIWDIFLDQHIGDEISALHVRH